MVLISWQEAVFSIERYRSHFATLCCAVIATLGCGAQQTYPQNAPAANVRTAAVSSFEVASIKSDRSGGGWMNFDHPPFSSHWSASNVTIKWLIEMAYQMKDYQISGQPAWANTKRYDVDADIDQATVTRIRALPPEKQIDQLRLMVLSLLTDRCKLSVTRVKRQLPSYVIASTKDTSSKLRPLAADPFPNNPAGLSTASNWGRGKMSLEETKGTLHNLANGLSILLGMPVSDQTSVAGNYSFTLRFTDDAQAVNGSVPDADFDRTLAAALRDQLGLRLESTKASVDAIIVDHVEEPSPN